MTADERKVRAALRATERWLRAAFPPGCRVRVVTCASVGGTDAVGGWDVYGECEPPVNGLATVRVSLDQSVEQARDTLMHEWAHVLTIVGLQASGQDLHADAYWITYGRIYRAFYDGGGLGVVEGK